MIGAMWGLLATMAVPSEKGMLPVHGAKLAYEVAGQGPAIVLIHAGVADMSMWDEPFRELSKRFRVVRYDTRGFGRSLTEAVAFSNRADLLALMDHLKIDRAVIVGNSRGGQIALDFTLENPSRVSGVVFVAGGLSGFDPKKAGIQNIPTAKEKVVFDRIDALYANKDLEQAAALEADTWASGPEQKPDRADAAIRQRLRRMILNNNRANITEPKPIVLSPPAAARLSELMAPVLVMIGDLDESATRSMCAYLAKNAPNGRKIVYRNTAHMISLEQPKEFIHEVSAFARSVDTNK